MLEKTGKLIKIESTHDNLRTDEVIGAWPFDVEVGQPFTFYSEPLEENMSIRYITTSTVQEVDWIYEKICEFKTRNSTYRLELN